MTNNFDATRLYLNVVSIYVRLMILLSRVDDRKAVLGLFNAAHEMIHGQCDPSFPRLGQVRNDRMRIKGSHSVKTKRPIELLGCLEGDFLFVLLMYGPYKYGLVLPDPVKIKYVFHFHIDK